MESPDIKRHIPELDGLRGIAVALVVLWHSRPEPVAMFGPMPFLFKALELGPAGVDLFFVLSGFLITGILLDTKGFPSFFGTFYMRRALRILPLYFFAVAAFFWVELPFLHRVGGADISSREQWWYWLFLMNWHDAAGHISTNLGAFWSLGVEEQFYLFWPLIVFFCARRFFPAVCVAVGTGSLLLRVVLYTGNFISPELLPEWIHRATVTRLDTLAIGALVAVIVRNANWAIIVRSWMKMAAPVSLVLYTLIWLSFPGLACTLGYTVAAIFFGCIVLICVTDEGSDHPLCRLARLGALRSMGRYSYAMYVLHLLVIRWLKVFALMFILPRVQSLLPRVPILVVSLISLGGCLAASYLAAFISWNLLERHFLQLKSRFTYSRFTPTFAYGTIGNGNTNDELATDAMFPSSK